MIAIILRTVFLAPGWRIGMSAHMSPSRKCLLDIADEPGVMEPTIKVALANGTLVDRHSTLPARIPTFLSSYVPIVSTPGSQCLAIIY
jgi:hypothetical protein